jgi:hypothetical protein
MRAVKLIEAQFDVRSVEDVAVREVVAQLGIVLTRDRLVTNPYLLAGQGTVGDEAWYRYLLMLLASTGVRILFTLPV